MDIRYSVGPISIKVGIPDEEVAIDVNIEKIEFEAKNVESGDIEMITAAATKQLEGLKQQLAAQGIGA